MYNIDEIKNKIICGDCLEKLKLFPDNAVDLIIADPPYGVATIAPEWDKIRDKKEYLKFSYKWMREIPRILKPHGTAYIFATFDAVAEIKIFLVYYCRLHLINWIIWKFDLGYHPRRRYKVRATHILYVVKNLDNYVFNKESIRILSNPKDRRCNPLGQIPSDVWDISEPRKNSKEYVGHKGQKPISLIKRMVLASSNEEDIILDPFFGSGTTDVVCKNLNRDFIGIEICPEYCRMARKRIDEIC